MNEKEFQHLDDFTVFECIGKGASGSVYRARHNVTKQEVAIKKIPIPDSLDTKSVEKLNREVDALIRCEHPFIAKLYGLRKCEHSCFIIQELGVGGNLLEYVNARGGIEESRAREIFVQILCAMDYLHNTVSLVHRDMKAENVILDARDNVRIIDFGMCHGIQNELLSTSCGSPAYVAPEVIRGKEYTNAVDVWSLGVLLYAITHCQLPFVDTNIKRLLQKVIFQEPVYSDSLSPELIDLLSKMMTKEPSERITLRDIFNHPWIAGNVYGFKVSRWEQELKTRWEGIFEKMKRLNYDEEKSRKSAEMFDYSREGTAFRILERGELVKIMASTQNAEKSHVGAKLSKAATLVRPHVVGGATYKSNVKTQHVFQPWCAAVRVLSRVRSK